MMVAIHGTMDKVFNLNYVTGERGEEELEGCFAGHHRDSDEGGTAHNLVSERSISPGRDADDD